MYTVSAHSVQYCALSHTCSKYKNSLIFLKPESQTVPTPLAEHPTDGRSHVVVVVDESAGGQKEPWRTGGEERQVTSLAVRVSWPLTSLLILAAAASSARI